MTSDGQAWISGADRGTPPSLGKEAFQGPPGLAGWEVGQVVVMRRDVHQPLTLDVGDIAHVVPRRQP
jgi:hypothetical protein